MSNGRPLHHAEAPLRIGLIGAECSGKSTLAAALADALPACLVNEALRDFVQQQGRTPHLDEQSAIYHEQVDREEVAASTCGEPWLVADPAPLMTAVYSIAYFGDDRLLDAALTHACGYEVVVWCDPEIIWRPDPGQRDGIARRDEVQALITAKAMPGLELRGATVLWVTGSPTQRVDTVVRWAWQHSSPGGAT